MRSKLLFGFVCSFAFAVLQGAPALAQDDDDFIILDDRGDEPDVPVKPAEPRPTNEDDDVPMSGRPKPTTNQRAGETASDSPTPPPPRRFEPTERVSEDLSVSFPADI